MPVRDLRIYNLFERLHGEPESWLEAARNARQMGFNALYLNPFHQSGASGSIYAIRDFGGYDEVIFPGLSRDEAHERMCAFLAECKAMGFVLICDLVINHTSVDCPWVDQYPQWYEHEEDGSIRRAGTFDAQGRYISWQECAKLSYADPDNGLWGEIEALCLRYLAMGFDGFRCDAAAHVPARFWKHLIVRLRKQYPDVLFLAEAFLASPGQQLALSQAGFQYIFNSARWWDYIKPWFIESNERLRDMFATIAFPENHDTNRLMEEEKGSLPRVLQKLFFTGLISSGFMITSGFEYGFRKPLNVFSTRKDDWEHTGVDLRQAISEVIQLRGEYPVFRADGMLEMLSCDEPQVTVLAKSIPGQTALMLMNRADCMKRVKTDALRARFPYHKIPGELSLEPYGFMWFVEDAQTLSESVVNEAYCLQAPRKMVLERIPLQPLRPGEALIRIRACGVCGSDVREMRGGRCFWPRMDAGGHEWTGSVVALEPPYEGLKIGDMAAFCLPRSGQGALQGGGFSRYAVVRNDCLVRLTPQDDPVRLVLAEPLAVAVHVLSMLAPAEDIAIIGSGAIAMLAARLLRLKRPSAQISLFVKYDREEHLAGLDVMQRFIQAQDSESEIFDAVIELSGDQASVPKWLKMLKKGGQMVFAGVYEDCPPVNLSDVMFRELRICGSFLYTREEFEEALRLIRVGSIRVDDLIRLVPFERAQEAFFMPSRSRIKAVVDHGE